MSQPTQWGVAIVGPKTPTAMAQDMKNSLDALLSYHSGATAPAYKVSGTIWCDTATADRLIYKVWDGSAWVPYLTVNTSTDSARVTAINPVTTLASGATANLGSVESDVIEITGTTGITSFGTADAGVLRTVRFAGILSLTHSTALLLPTAGDITTAVGDSLVAVSLGSGNWRVLSYSSATIRVSPTGIMSNVGIDASSTSGVLTISLVDAGGNTLSPSSSASIPFRAAAVGTGTQINRTVSAETTLVLSSGSTLGFTANRPSKLWIVAFDDGGTVRLGAINCRDNANALYPLEVQEVASSTAEGSAGGADSAKVFYTGTAVTSKAYTVIGYLVWSTGLSTAGTWTNPDVKQVFTAGVDLPGTVVQRVVDRYTTYSNSAAQIPLDNTIPQNTEGAQVASLSISPKSAANLLRVQVSGNFSASAAAWGTFACFQNTTADAFLSNSVTATTSVWAYNFVGEHTIGIVGNTAQTIALRFGIGGSGTWVMNGGYSASGYGGSTQGTVLSVEEIAA